MKFKNNKTVKMKKLKYYTPFIFLALVVILTFPGCKEELPIVPPPPPPPEQKDSIVVSIMDVTHRSISLSMQLTVSNRQSKNIKLFREFNSNEYLIAEYPVTVTDTTIIDDDNGVGLLLDTTYIYYAVSIDSTGNVKDTSNTVTARTLAPTTHNYTWTEYTIGEWQSALYDVWGTDENNVYAVGGVKINDTTYGILKWDGIEWKPVSKAGGVSIFGFAGDDIWTVGGSIFHFDGNEWMEILFSDQVLVDNIPYTSVWGTSSSNLYLGNQWGKIIHWDGEKATDVGIDADDLIADIRGFSENEIYAVAGTEVSFDRDQLYYFDGNTWQVIKEADTFPNNELLAKPLLSVYGRNSKDLYLAGRRIYRRINDQWLEEGNFNTIHQKIRGRNSNNIVAVGNQSTIYHYNGVDWLKLEPTSNTNIKFNSVFVTQRKIFVVGRNSSIAFIYIGENF